jgi:hypothetical protein
MAEKIGLQQAFDAGFDAVKQYVDRSFEQFERRLEALEAKQAEHVGIKYLGVFAEGTEYSLGNFVTHAGSLWHCETRTKSRPGSDGCWKLATKRGQFK